MNIIDNELVDKIIKESFIKSTIPDTWILINYIRKYIRVNMEN